MVRKEVQRAVRKPVGGEASASDASVLPMETRWCRSRPGRARYTGREEDASPPRKLAGELSGYPAYAGELAKRQRNRSRRQDRPRYRGSNRYSVSGSEVQEMRAKPRRCSLAPG